MAAHTRNGHVGASRGRVGLDLQRLPRNADLEASILGGIILKPSVLADLRDLEVDDFFLLPHKAVFSAMRSLEDAQKPIDVITLEAELERAEKLAAVGGIAFLGELALKVPTVDNVVHYAQELRVHRRNRDAIVALASALERAYGWPHDPTELVAETVGELERLAARAPRSPQKWFRATDMVEEILRFAHEPWVGLKLGPEEIVRVRAGGTAVVIGGPGTGKSSLVAGFLLAHALHTGPAIALSIELPADEIAARLVGIRCDASWEDVLRGKVRREFMQDALALPRLYVLERRQATLRNLADAIDAARAEYPKQPILVAIDYAQIMETESDDQRLRVMEAFARIDDLAREKRVAAIAVSQMSRASAKQARAGERIGAEAADLGAESAAIERYASVTLTIGKVGEPREDGSRSVELSIGKGRMTEGDRVVPLSFVGKSGLYRVTGEAQDATSVREQRQTEREAKEQAALENAFFGLASASKEPLTREQLIESAAGRPQRKRAAVAKLIAERRLVEVQRKMPRSRAWMVWTPERAAAAGVPVVATSPQQEIVTS